MSHYGSPPDQPEEGAAQPPADPDGAPPPPPGPTPAAPPPADQDAEKPWSPYPDNWDDLKAPTPPASTYQPSPYGEPAPYDVQQPGAATPVNPYGGQVSTAPPAFGFGGYASWSSRVVAYLIDGVLGALAGFPLWIGYGMLISNATTTTDANGVKQLHFHSDGSSIALILLGVLSSLAFFIWNQCIRQGRTGASLGKSVLALRLVHADMQPIGGGLAFVRYLLNIVNAIPCYLGYLWPLWDAKRQTFADKIMSTYVIKATTPQPRVY
jgi:uncharacterized RDD family membrane protein YckC